MFNQSLIILNESVHKGDADIIRPEEKQAATWRDALDYPSSYQAGYMRSFLEDGKWWELIPRFDNESWFMPKAGTLAVCAAQLSCPVRDFPKTAVSEQDMNGAPQKIVPGLSELLVRPFP